MRVAVVIPLYRQAQFLVDAVSSVLKQSFEDTGAVIVNDGCPDPTSHQLGTAFAASYGDRVAYVRQPNAGLSAARNKGIRAAMARWPEVETFFFLDADNVLMPDTVSAMYDLLGGASDLDWVCSTLQLFGVRNAIWHSATPANLFHMLFANQADAGSLVRRRVFENGIFFDEEMRHGYEDWEFFIRLLRNGHRGLRATNGVMLYRVKQQSMLTDSQKKHERIVADIHDRHRDLLEPRRLTAIEHAHCPRFLWVEPSGSILTVFTDPDEAAPVSELPRREDWPPVLFIGSRDTWQALAESRVLRSVLLMGQAVAPKCPVSFRIEVGGKDCGIESDSEAGAPNLLCFYSGSMQVAPSMADKFDFRSNNLLHGAKRFVARTSGNSSTLALTPLTGEDMDNACSSACAKGVFALEPKRSSLDEYQEPTRYLSWLRNCVKLETTYPLSDNNRLHVGIAVPWLKLGGVDQCIIQLARVFRRLVPNIALHLVCTEDGVEGAAGRIELFDEVLFLGSLERERRARACDSIFRSMDLVINAHSEIGYESLKWRGERPREQRLCVYVSYLHVIDEARGKLVGFPPMAADLSHAIDSFAVISDNLRSFLINQGVNPDAVRLARNAPVVRPPSIDAAYGMAALKAHRLARGERPLRLLFAGRADYQKGIGRLKRMTELLISRGAPFELKFVGDSHLLAEDVTWPPGPIHTHSATHDETELAAHYREADVCVLLSRWEGVPLSLLDAMAHGCVVVATDVGGVPELVEDARSGFVIPNSSDEDVANQAAEVIDEVLRDKTGSAAVREAAVATAWRYSWEDAAEVFVRLLPDAVKARHGLSESRGS